MTQRPREHILETSSERAFERVLPDEWTSDPPKHDYGLDLRVEIFDLDQATKGSHASGLEFAVQLKATDGETADATTVSVKRSHIDYWLSLPYPVLVVRYLAATDELYGMWVHERKRGPEKQGEKYASFKFEPTDRLDPATIPALRAEVVAFRKVRSGDIRLPLRLRMTGSYAASVNEAQINTDIAARLGRGAVQVDRNIDSALTVCTDAERVAVDLGGGIAVTWHTTGMNYVPGAADVLFILGLCLGRQGNYQDAAICLRASLDAPLVGDPHVLVEAVSMAMSGRDVDAAVLLLEQPGASREPMPLLLAMLVHFCMPMDGPTAHRIEMLYHRLIEEAHTPDSHGRALYYRAQTLRAFNLHIEASLDLEGALVDYPSLADDAAFWTHRAGSAFILEHYHDAAEFYGRAITLGDDSPRTRTQRTEALLMSGRYRDAAEAVSGLDAPTWDETLIWLVAQRVMARFGLEQQERNPDEAEKLWVRSPKTVPTAEVVAADAITAAAVYQPSQVGDFDGALDVLVMVRLRRPDARVTALATTVAYSMGIHPQILSAIASFGKSGNGDEYVRALLAVLKELEMEGPEANALFDLVNSARSDMPSEPPET